MNLRKIISMKLYANYHNGVIYPWNTIDEKIKLPYEKITEEIIQEIEIKVQYLINMYKQQLEQNRLDQDKTNFEKTFNGARRLLLLDIIRDLEELLH